MAHRHDNIGLGRRRLLSALVPEERTPTFGNVESRPSRVLDAIVEELKIPHFGASRSDRHLHRITALLRFSLKPSACNTLLTSTAIRPHTLAEYHVPASAGLPLRIAATSSAVNSSGLDADAVAEGIVSMPATASSPCVPAEAHGSISNSATTTTSSTSDTAATTTPTTTKTTTNSTTAPASSNPILKTRKSASQLAQRLSSWSGASSSSSHPPRPETSYSNSRSDPKLRSVSSNDSLGSCTSQSETQRASFLRRLSPGLAARVKLLDPSNKSPVSAAQRAQGRIGKIPEEQIKELDRLHQDLSIKVQKKGKAWSRQQPVFGERLVVPKQREDRGVDKEVESQPGEAGPPVDEVLPSIGTSDTMTAVESSPAMVVEAGASHGSSSSALSDQTDFEKYLSTSTEEADSNAPPPPPPKDSPPAPSGSANGSENGSSYFNPLGLHRTDSIYSFSRASFSNQLSQLTSISLPQPSTLEASISAISTAPAAVRALTSAAEQIQKWINKASDVLSGLDAEDDVEWAAAGGREGLDEVDKAVSKFENLINVYVQAIENVQLRGDIADVGPEQLTNIVVQMESTLKSWSSIRTQLKGVKEQVELAMEWEELWNAVLGDVGLEMENLSRLIFEMEEKRHQMGPIQTETEPSSGLDINELETIVEETPANGSATNTSRFSLAPVFPPSNSSFLAQPTSQNPQDEASLLALFARMQPLRASLDFLPMRLSMFQSRADKIFPSACEELEEKRHKLEKGYKKLETDAEALRRELGEDRWIIVFRNAGKQAHKMCESVERSVQKLQEAIDGGIQHSNPTALAKRAENFEAKKVHYGSAIERVLTIIQKGINDRLTVNGEIIRLHADLQARFEALNEMMREMDAILDELAATRSHQMRDSISSIVTLDSPATHSAIDTPGSSPASSIVMSAGGRPNIPSRRSSATGNSISRAPPSKLKRYSGLPQPVQSLNQTPRRPSYNRSSTATPGLLSPTTPRFKMTSPSPNSTPRPASRISSSSRSIDNRPRWNSSCNTNDLVVGHCYKPLSSATPSPHRKTPSLGLTPRSASSTLPVRSPLSRDSSASPAPGLRPPSRLNRGVTSSPMPDRNRDISPSPARPSLIDPPPYSKLRKGIPALSSALSTTPRSRQSYSGNPSARMTPATQQNSLAGTSASGGSRPGTALGHSNRRTSLLPLPKSKASGRDSSLGSRPPWR